MVLWSGDKVFTCSECGAKVPITVTIGREDVCPRCKNDLHTCRNCSRFDPAYNNQCREPKADPVVDKSKANFCEFFEPLLKLDLHNARSGPTPDDARQAFESLFKK
jgi:hypothetical protein